MSSTHANSLMLAHNPSGSKIVLQSDEDKNLKVLSKISDGLYTMSVNTDGSILSNST